MSEQTLDLLTIVAEVLDGVDAPLSIQDNSYPRSYPTDPIGMVCDSAPAYRVLVVVNGPMLLPGGPWVSVTHTKRFGFTPIRDGYTYLEPPDGVDRTSAAQVKEWLADVLPGVVATHAPRAAEARAADAGQSGPVEAWDAIRRLD